MAADLRGLPIIAGLCILNGAIVSWNIAGLHAQLQIDKALAVGEANLQQAESRFVACLKHGLFTVGTAIYHCEAKRSELTTAQVPEMAGAAGWSGVEDAPAGSGRQGLDVAPTFRGAGVLDP